MSEQLGTLEDLPEDYRAELSQAGVAPLWPMMRNVLPHGTPNPVTKPGYWSYDAVRPLLLPPQAQASQPFNNCASTHSSTRCANLSRLVA